MDEKTGYHRGTREKESATLLRWIWDPTLLLSPLFVSLSCFNLQWGSSFSGIWNCMMKEPYSDSSFIG